ncbi:Receptor-type tyrosine-protein phosphatase gamma, partial [Toxocara canis]
YLRFSAESALLTLNQSRYKNSSRTISVLQLRKATNGSVYKTECLSEARCGGLCSVLFSFNFSEDTQPKMKATVRPKLTTDLEHFKSPSIHFHFSYTDVLCLDKTRVILRGRTKDNDYIHANWVELPSHRKYICTQGPLNETVEDFWLMVFKAIPLHFLLIVGIA